VLLPIAMVAATAAIAALTVPAARGLGLGLTALADRRRRRGRPPRLTARVVVVVVGVGLALAMGAAYLGFVRPLTRRFALRRRRLPRDRGGRAWRRCTWRGATCRVDRSTPARRP
jgi:type II secretory pathway component PulM